MTKIASRELLVLSLLLSAIQAVVNGTEVSGQDDPPSIEQAVGVGRWESAHDDAGKREVQIQIERFDNNSITGSLIVVGSSYLNKTRLEGRVEGKEVYGVLVGADSQQIGTFVGMVADSGLSGTYTTNQGDAGSWNWAGTAAPQVLENEADQPATAH